VTIAQECRTGPSGYIGWHAGTTTLCHSRLYPPQYATMNLATSEYGTVSKALCLYHFLRDTYIEILF
jgi:hypothetical protein